MAEIKEVKAREMLYHFSPEIEHKPAKGVRIQNTEVRSQEKRKPYSEF